MTHEDLRTLLREDVAGSEPAFTMSSAQALRAGRRIQRVRRTGGGIVAAAVGAATALVVPGLLNGASEAPRVDAATTQALAHYSAREMPGILNSGIQATVGDDLPQVAQALVFAADSQEQQLPMRYADKASSWHAVYTRPNERAFDVTLSHGVGDMESSPAGYCKTALGSGYVLTCTADEIDDGTVVYTTTSAVRKDTAPTVPAPIPGSSWQVVGDATAVKPSKLWFQRSVVSLRGGRYLTTARETVKVPTLHAARSAWDVSTEHLRELALRPDFVFPEPPVDPESGCGWMLPPKSYTVSCRD